jgi:hypothetical protein
MLVAFAAYLFTLAPTVYGLDSAEFSLVVHNLGVPHSTGYPLYVLLGKLFMQLPVGDMAYRLNLMSAVFAAATVGITYNIAFLATRRVLPSIVATGMFAFSYYFWSSAVIAEVYTPHAALLATTVYVLLLWFRGGSNQLLYVAALLWGLSFGNHMSTVLTAPVFVYVAVHLLRSGRGGLKELLIMGLAMIPGLLTYVYIPWRFIVGAEPYLLGHYDGQGEFIRIDTTTLSGIWWLVSAKQFDSILFAHTGTDVFYEVGRILWWILSNYLGIGFVLGILGWVRNYSVDRTRWIVLTLIFAINLLFFATYGATDKHTMIPHVHLIWAVWIAEGLLVLFVSFKRYFSSWRLGTGSAVQGRIVRNAPMVLLLLPLVSLTVNYSYADVSSYTWVRDQYEDVLNNVEQGSLILAWWNQAAPMAYLQSVEGIRTDVKVVDRFFLNVETERELVDLSLPNRPIYVFGHLPPSTIPFESQFFVETDVLSHRIYPSGGSPPD